MGRYNFVFRVLPFGLASACYAFTKLLRPLIRYWQGQGLWALLHLDNGIVAVSGKDAAEKASCRVREDLAKAGLVEYTAKCSWVPSQEMPWLGFHLNLVWGVYQYQKKNTSIKQLWLVSYRHSSWPTSLAKLYLWLWPMGQYACLMTRSMYALLNTCEYQAKISPCPQK